MTTTANEEFIRKNKIVMVDEDGNTELHYAAATGNLEKLQQEMSKGQRLDPVNFLGWTPLMMAVRNDQEEAVGSLLLAGANATKENRYGFNVFLISVVTGNIDLIGKILNHLLCGGVSRLTLERIMSPLSLAILMGHQHVFKYFLRQSFNINATTPITGITPLMFAAAIGSQKCVKKLIKKKADTSKRNTLGRTFHDIVQIKSAPYHIDIVDEVAEYNNQMQMQQQCPAPSQTTSIPMIMVNSPLDCGNQILRTSSNIMSPYFIPTPPNISPMSPLTPIVGYNVQPHFMYPHELAQAYYLSPFGAGIGDVLNANIHDEVFVSPQF